MKENEYNAIGIESQLDWPRIKKLMTIGLVAACLVFIGDWMLGLFGIFLEDLSYFGIYRLMAEKSPKHAHGLRTGIIGYIAFGACGVHVPCVMVAWLYNYLIKVSPDAAYKCCLKFATYFMIPSTVIFTIFCIYMVAVQISAFVKGMTPYPKWCFIFNIVYDLNNPDYVAAFLVSVIRVNMCAFGYNLF